MAFNLTRICRDNAAVSNGHGREMNMPGRTSNEKDPSDQPTRTREISSQELLGGRRELIILHNEERYTLRVTANRKLILTK